MKVELSGAVIHSILMCVFWLFYGVPVMHAIVAAVVSGVAWMLLRPVVADFIRWVWR